MAEPAVRPARDYAEAAARFEALRALDGPAIIPQAYSRFWSHQRRTARAVVLLHGFTTCPEQYARLSSILHARGHSVIVPRLPGHGDVSRRSDGLARVSAQDLLAAANEAVDIACGAGECVVVAGLSLSGTLAAALAQRRADVARSLCIVPLFGLTRLNLAANRAVRTALKVAPNVAVPWDPFGDGSQIPTYGYPRFPTHALAECLRLGEGVYDRAQREAPAAGETVMVLNEKEPACNNALACEIAGAWNGRRAGAASVFVFHELPANHDIVDPTNPLQRIDVVYPKLVELIEG